MHLPFEGRGYWNPAAVISVIIVAILSAGCATSYNELMEGVRQDYYAGNLQGSLMRIDERIANTSEDDEKTRVLFLLERSMIHQRMGNFEAARNDLMAADERLEVLDFTNDVGGNIAEFTTSPSLTTYRGQPHEKILLNTLNMCNFLAAGDLTGARIEGRRAVEMHDYQEQVEQEEQFNYSNGLTQLLYGLVFDASGRPNDAYIALKKAYELTGASFLEPMLYNTARDLGHSDARRWEQEFGAPAPLVGEGQGSALVVVMNGRTPIRVEREIVLTPGQMQYSHDGVTMSAYGKKSIRIPELIPQSHRYRMGRIAIGSDVSMDLIRSVDIETQAMERFNEEKPGIITASITRFLIKAIASEVAAASLEKSMRDEDKKEKENKALKDFFDSLMFATLDSLDVTDVRCWNFLPAEILVGLVPLPPGDHNVQLTMTGTGSPLSQSKPITIKAGNLTVVLFFVTL